MIVYPTPVGKVTFTALSDAMGQDLPIVLSKMDRRENSWKIEG